MKKSIFDQMVEIVVRSLGVDKSIVSEDASIIDNLGADSLDSVELVMEVEEHFDINITEEEAEKLTTVKDYVELVKSKTENR